MSAIAWEHPAVRPEAPRRPRLVVLEGGGEGVEPEAGLRLTARGRLVLLVLAAAVLAGVLGIRVTGAAGAGEPAHTITVTPGQTLSEIAAAELPGMSVDHGIVAIQVANKLSTARISAGQHLVIPQG
ncbi:LysM peptidoglycan-binding domain-containing protein [Phycicoccus sonneratiae]|uniref:LysM peptidoglycan-binding domain-containing protein n=1 Tax=Phycicoccus sonneratiae TaxID=2807628 RepID=A0ABS2CK85_9MICO|nr:LysM peptidoglycan-binding domain-containing protein [Phycicoccus sonneraticus]MBM6400294.1 LysM peptidoglycan-binding domain-containing protein [Phycicoccus sonneraticus]